MRQVRAKKDGLKRIELSLVFLVILVGAAIRMLHLDERPFWVDEAESSINGLSILQFGYPTDSYLGIPIFENTHVWFWPDNPEYEFRDVSYSDNHLAVYHGWLPLYGIAASFLLHGVRPDQAGDTLSPKHDLAEQKLMTRAARLPSVFFGTMFLPIIFLGGKAIYGRDAAWAALIIAAIYPYHLEVSNQARYYAAQVTLTTACCVLLWLIIERCRWMHVFLGAAAFSLLFHTHLLSFLTAGAMAAICMPFIIRRHTDWFKKMAVFAAALATGTLPWILATGFYRHQSRIPRAWQLLNLPSDLLRYPPFSSANAAAGLLILCIVLTVRQSRGCVSRDLGPSIARLGPALLFLGGWAATGYTAFLLCIPAVSFTQGRLNLSYWGPLFLLFAIMSAAITRIIALQVSRRSSPILATSVMLMIVLCTGHRIELGHRPGEHSWRVYQDIFRQLDSMNLDSATRLYAAPNRQLVMSVYSGLPIQDITPVRKTFLDSYRGDIVYIDADATVPTGILEPDRVRRAALLDGVKLTAEVAQQTSARLVTRRYRESILKMMAPNESPKLEPLPEFAKSLLDAQNAEVAAIFRNMGYELVTRGFEIRDWSDWCAVLKYRFVNPDTRRGKDSNFADRLRGSDAVIVTRSEPVIFYRSRWHPPHSTDSLNFRFVE